MKNIFILFLIFTNVNTFGQTAEENCLSARKKYLEQNPDVAKVGMDPWNHYLSHGKLEGRKWPKCDDNNINILSHDESVCVIAKNNYLEENPDVRRAMIDPWLHYLTFGKKENRKWHNCNNSNNGQSNVNTKNLDISDKGDYINNLFNVEEKTKLDCQSCTKAIELYYNSYIERSEINSDLFYSLKTIVQSCMESPVFETDCLNQEIKRKALFFYSNDPIIPEFKVSRFSSDYKTHYSDIPKDYKINLKILKYSKYNKTYYFSKRFVSDKMQYVLKEYETAIINQRLNCRDCKSIIDNYFNITFDYKNNNIFDLETTQKLRSEALRCAYQQYYTKNCNGRDFKYKMEYLTQYKENENITRDEISFYSTFSKEIQNKLRNDIGLKNNFYENYGRWNLRDNWSQVKQDSISLKMNFDIDITVFQTKGLWGCKTAENITFINPKYTSLQPFVHNNKLYFIASIDKSKESKIYGILDAEENTIVSFELNRIYGIDESNYNKVKNLYTPSNSSIIYYEKVSDNDDIKFGMIMPDLKLRDKLYDKIIVNKGKNIIIAKLNNNYGLLNKEGKEISLLKYSNIGGYTTASNYLPTDSLILVFDNNKVGILNYKGIEIVSPEFDEIGYTEGEDIIPGCIPFVKDKKHGLLNFQGKCIIDPFFDNKIIFDKYRNAIVLKNNLYGIINYNKNFEVKCEFQSIRFWNGNYLVNKNNKYGIIATNGFEIIPPLYDTIANISSEMYLISKSFKVGIVKNNGKVILEPKYDDIKIMDENTFCTKINNKWGLTDQNGKEIISFKYDEPFKFINGKASVKLNGSMLKINLRDEIVVNDFQDSDFSNLMMNGLTVKHQIEKKFENLFSSVSTKRLLSSMLGTSFAPKEMIIDQTNEIKKTVEGWLNGPMTEAQLNEFYSIAKSAAVLSELATAFLMSTLNSVTTSSNNESKNGKSRENKPNSNTSEPINNFVVCQVCKPHRSEGHFIYDYDFNKRQSVNQRHVLRPGFTPCDICYGTGVCRGNGWCDEDLKCRRCHGDRFLVCEHCKGTGYIKVTSPK